MKISQEVRRTYANTDMATGEQAIQVKMLDDPLEGMRQKSQEFLASGSELYHPAVASAETVTEE